MVAVLWEANTPIGNLTLLANFNKLFQSELGHGEPLATYMYVICTPIGPLCGGGIKIHPIIINLFVLKGLGSAYEPVKQDFTICGEQFTALTLV